MKEKWLSVWSRSVEGLQNTANSCIPEQIYFWCYYFAPLGSVHQSKILKTISFKSLLHCSNYLLVIRPLISQQPRMGCIRSFSFFLPSFLPSFLPFFLPSSLSFFLSFFLSETLFYCGVLVFRDITDKSGNQTY